VVRQLGVVVLADAAVLVVAARPVVGREATTLVVIVGHVGRVGRAPAVTLVARAVVMPVAVVVRGAEEPMAGRMVVVPVTGAMVSIVVAARPRVVADEQIVVGAPRAQGGAAVVLEAVFAVVPDPRRDRDVLMAHAVPTGHDGPMERNRAAPAAVVPVVEDARQVADVVALGDHQAMPVVVIVAQAVAAMQGGVVATVEMQRGHRVRNRARQRSVVRRRCVHAAAGCVNHKTSPGPPSRSAGRTSARSTRSGGTMR